MAETGDGTPRSDRISPWPLLLVAALLVLGLGAALATSAPAAGHSSPGAASPADPPPAAMPAGTHVSPWVETGAVVGLLAAIGLLVAVSERFERADSPAVVRAESGARPRAGGWSGPATTERERGRSRFLERSPRRRRHKTPHDRSREEAVSERPSSLRDAS